MLKKRIITACILIPLAIGGILGLPLLLENTLLQALPFALISGLVFILGANEWVNLCGVKSTIIRIFYIIALMMLALEMPNLVNAYNFFIMAACGWLILSIGVMCYPRMQSIWHSRIISLMVGFFVLVPSWLALNWLENCKLQGLDNTPLQGPHLVLYLMILIWGADIGAYFTGRRFGKHKLLVLVSPGKTWEGAWGAIISSMIIGIGGAYYFKYPYLIFVPLSIVTVLFSIMGDLLESLYKRVRGVKDSGKLLPGHGGVLDRIDSLTAALPIFVGGLLLFAS